MGKIPASEVDPQRLMEEWLHGANPRKTLIHRDKLFDIKGFESVRWIDVPAFHSAEVLHKT